ncbi:MAG: hypothetical protein R2828_35640 [Saprospiraceae bacterium]
MQALASDEPEALDLIHQNEIWILKRALKDCIRNAQAWEANKRKGKGTDATNEAGAKKYRDLAAAIETRMGLLGEAC